MTVRFGVMSRFSAATLTSLVLGFTLAGCGSGTPNPNGNEGATAGGESVAPVTDPEAMQLLMVAEQLAGTGQCARAIPEAIEPALAIFERQHRGHTTPPRASRIVNGGSVTSIDATPEGSDAAPTAGPEWSDALYLHAFCLVDAGRVAEAGPVLERALSIIPNDVVYACELGHVRHAESRWEDAMQLFRSAYENAEALQTSGANQGALLFGQALDWWARRSLRGIGYSLYELGRLEEAEIGYRRVLEIDPNDERALGELQLIASRRGAI